MLMSWFVGVFSELFASFFVFTATSLASGLAWPSGTMSFSDVCVLDERLEETIICELSVLRAPSESDQ